MHRNSLKHGSRLRKYVYNTTNNGSFYTQAIYSHDRVTCIINYPQEIRSILVRVSVCEIIYNHMTHGTCRLWTLLMTNITKYNYKLHGIWLVEKTECGIGVRNTESWKTRSLIKIESLGKITNFLTDSVLRLFFHATEFGMHVVSQIVRWSEFESCVLIWIQLSGGIQGELINLKFCLYWHLLSWSYTSNKIAATCNKIWFQRMLSRNVDTCCLVICNLCVNIFN